MRDDQSERVSGLNGGVAVVALLAVAGVLAVWGCSGAARTSDQSLHEVGYLQLKDHLADKKKGPTVLVDVRPPARFDAGHIPGAINIPLPSLYAGEPRFAEAKQIIVYAADWVDVLGPAAAKRLTALGYKNVYLFRGGLKLWQDEGKTGAPAPIVPAN